MKSFTLDSLREKYGIRRAIVTELVRGGFIVPARGQNREYRFSFHDVVLLRMAQDLHAAGVSARKLARFLKDLALSLPETPVAGMRVTTAGRELVVREDGRLRNRHGQLVLDFSATAAGSAVRHLSGGQAASPSPLPARRGMDAMRHFEQAEMLVEENAAAAAGHYRQAAEIDPAMLDAWVNLSCVLLDAGQAIEAYACCQEGLLHHAGSALLLYNQGLALEEMQQLPEALASYQQALACDASLRDAHYNAGRVADQLGRKTEAIRHFSAYRRSQK